MAKSVQNAATRSHIEKRVHRQPHYVVQKLRVQKASGTQTANVERKGGDENRNNYTADDGILLLNIHNDIEDLVRPLRMVVGKIVETNRYWESGRREDVSEEICQNCYVYEKNESIMYRNAIEQRTIADMVDTEIQIIGTPDILNGKFEDGKLVNLNLGWLRGKIGYLEVGQIKMMNDDFFWIKDARKRICDLEI